jgi:soluble lytic murein transglycosylase
MKKALKFDLRPGRRQALVGGLILVVAALAAGADCANAQQAGVPTLRPEPSAIAFGTRPLGRPEMASLPPGSDQAPSQAGGFSSVVQSLEIDDANRYHQIFELQRQGRFREAELAMDWLNDHRLVGHVLAQRYLSARYTASYRELASWLARYGDHPEALRLYKLALKRQPSGAARPAKPDIDVFHGGTPDGGAIASDPHWQAGLAAWRRGDLTIAAGQFEQAADAIDGGDWNNSAAAYWAARAHLKNREPAKVSLWLRQAAQYSRTFYGQLARRALGLDAEFNWTAKPISDAGAQALALSGRGQRALGLLQIGEVGLAEQEMQSLLASAGPDLAAGLHAVAQFYQLPSISLGLGVLAELKPNIHADADLYPVPRWQPRGGFTIDRALLFAMVRQESAFNVVADNASGAAGLMQLMPGTARAVGGGRQDLHDPIVNLTLGQEYMRRLLADPAVNNNLFMMAIAYNAGPGMLAKWRAADATSDPLLFIESLPKDETRNFVQRVMANIWIYQQRFGQPTPSLDHVAAGGWPIYQSQDGYAAASSQANGQASSGQN